MSSESSRVRMTEKTIINKKVEISQNLLERINVLRHILPLDILNNQGNDTSRVLKEMEDLISEIK